MDSPLVTFLSGVLAGSALACAVGELANLVRARKAKRETDERAAKLQAVSAAMEREMATVVEGLRESVRRAATGEPTPGCDCPPCKAKRQIAQKASN